MYDWNAGTSHIFLIKSIINKCHFLKNIIKIYNFIKAAIEKSHWNSETENYGHHFCVAKWEEDICEEFIYEKDTGYPGNDINRYDITNGLIECENLCRANDECVGFSSDPDHHLC